MEFQLSCACGREGREEKSNMTGMTDGRSEHAHKLL
jgi:hypothetical protein